MIESEMQDKSDISALESQLRQIYARATFVEKTHQKMADKYTSRYKKIKLMEIILSALTSTSLLAAVLGDGKVGTVVAAFFSTTLLCFTLYFKEAGLNEKAQQHSEFGSKLWGLRQQVFSLLVDLQDGESDISIRKKRDYINEQLEIAYKSAPRTDAGAYFGAQKTLRKSDDTVFSNEYINGILPGTMHKRSNSK
ncbi:SLATT domain-containing protein [Comamonas sp. 17RB]|uniref:SLATT domain-containing protein n=1 Tax=Comamonas sp. 17RB TaxID=3047025 RepID=UPI0024B69B37|nr:SLATT domain-containing protein [Comamonas sp. 17RB]MDI9853993.1 SLATT domain-containing protein [Comamonas sp. 17RB]